MDRPLIACEAVEVRYPGNIQALGPLNLSVAEGDFVALVGPSGSGKTTLLNLIGGLDQPSSGRLTVDGRDLTGLSDRELSRYRSTNVGFVFQSYHVHPERTALQNLLVPLYFTDQPLREGKDRARQLLERLGLKGMEDRPVGRLSGGQRQRVAIGRALMNKPRLLLADEPIGNLDAASAQIVLDVMAELNREGLTVLTATHDPLLLEIATSTIRLENGVLAER